MSEAEYLSEIDPGGYYEREPTRYTTCCYCSKPFPLREISEHARFDHPEESTKYTDCWHCGGRYSLREIRAHSRQCAGKAG